MIKGDFVNKVNIYKLSRLTVCYTNLNEKIIYCVNYAYNILNFVYSK